MKKETALRIIFECAGAYRDNLVNRNLLFICANSAMRINSIETVFGAGNFLHMTGVKFKGGKELTPNSFYSLCIDRRLTVNDFEMANRMSERRCRICL